MERVLNVGKVLRNNWKKSIFFSGLAAWGGKWLYDREIEFQVMRAYCQEAIQYGNEKIPPMMTSRHVTVILNPAANKKKSKADYEKYCAPLLHLAGLKVSIVQTEAEGQAKDLMEIMDNTDCVLIAGGDGTVHEAITGLLRRQDSNRAVQTFPIGIAPIGKRNSIAYRLNNFDMQDKKAKIIGESTMSLIREALKEVNVMKIEGNQGRPVYSLGEVNIGQLRNTFIKNNDYWYFGEKAKPYLTFFFQSWKNLSEYWNEKEDVNVSYTEPCSGCSKCYQNKYPDLFVNKSNTGNDNNSNWRWWHALLPRNVEPKVKDPREIEIERIKNIENENCNLWKEIKLNCKNILVQNDLENGRLEMFVHENTLGTMDFIREGVAFTKDYEFIKNHSNVSAEDVEKMTFFKRILGKEFKIHMKEFEDENEVNHDENDNEETVENKENISGESILDGEKSTNVSNNSTELTDNIQSKLISSNLEELNVFRKRKPITELDGENYKNNFKFMTDGDKKLNQIENNDETEENNIKNETNTNNKNNNNDEVDDDDNKRWLSIDNENYEISSKLNIELLQNRLKIYFKQHNNNNNNNSDDNH